MEARKILIVEDDAVAGESIKENLEEWGYTVVDVCSTGEEAIQKAGETQPDLILMDIKLEGSMDGIETSKKIHDNLGVPIIYLTGYGDRETIERAKITGPYGFINKPARIEDITSAIEMALYRHKMDLRQIEEKEAALKAMKAAEQFLAHFTHEIRNPLSVIKGYSGLLKDFGATDQQVEFIQKIENSTDKAARLANDLLDYSKMKVGKFTLETKDFAIREEINHIIDTYSPMFGKKGIELQTDIAPDVPEYVTGDPYRLEQILTNLLGNALKFTKKGSCNVNIRCEEPGEKEESGKDRVTLLFSVQDTGIGIPKNKQKTIFDPFTQANSSHTVKYGGTGLGLAIAKQLVELMDGEIWVISQPGKGTTFAFTAIFEIGKNHPDNNL
jgi:signal transduction histidine kinase